MAEQQATALAEWKRHWLLAATCTIGLTFSPTGTYSLGLFMEPLHKEFGWGRGEVSAGMMVFSVFAVLFSSPAGALIDRFGARRVAIPGTIGCIVAIASLSLANGSMVQWLALWSIYAVSTLFIKTTSWTAAISKAFTASRGLALGVVLCGIGISQALTPVIAQPLIDNYGWRHAYQFLGFGWGGLVLLMLVLFLKDYNGEPGAATAPEAGQKPAAPAVLPGYSFREAMRTRQVRQICGAVLINSLIGVGIAIHLVPILVETGLSRAAAAGAAGLSGLAAIGGKLLTGMLLDKFRGNLVPFASYAMPAVGLLILLLGLEGAMPAIIAALCIGYAAGATTQSSAYLVTRYAGLRSYGAVFGILSSLIGLTMGFAPWFAGRVYDVTGSYHIVLMAGVPCAILAGLLVVGLGPYPNFDKAGEPAD